MRKKERKSNRERRKQQTFGEFWSNHLDVPAEVLSDIPYIMMDGMHRLWVENYKSIVEYEDCRIRLATGEGRIRINGNRLRIEEYSRDGMRIVGEIEQVCFEKV